MNLHLDANPGRVGEVVGWGKGRCSQPVLQNSTESEAFDFALLESLHRCIAMILAGQLHIVRALEFMSVLCPLAFKDLSEQLNQERLSCPLPVWWW